MISPCAPQVRAAFFTLVFLSLLPNFEEYQLTHFILALKAPRSIPLPCPLASRRYTPSRLAARPHPTTRPSLSPAPLCPPPRRRLALQGSTALSGLANAVICALSLWDCVVFKPGTCEREGPGVSPGSLRVLEDAFSLLWLQLLVWITFLMLPHASRC